MKFVIFYQERLYIEVFLSCFDIAILTYSEISCNRVVNHSCDVKSLTTQLIWAAVKSVGFRSS